VVTPLVLTAEQPGNILSAARLLRDGGIVVVPTDTVYGLAASVFREEAVDRVFQAKRRQPDARVPILLATAADLPLLATHVPAVAWQLIHRFWPGPLTLVLPARSSLPESITRGGGTVAVRVPAARSCLELLQALGEPIVGTSANISGRPAATTAAAAIEQLDGAVDAVLVDDGAVQAGVASTVVDLTGGAVTARRLGALGIEQIRQTLGPGMPVREQLTVHPQGR